MKEHIMKKISKIIWGLLLWRMMDCNVLAMKQTMESISMHDFVLAMEQPTEPISMDDFWASQHTDWTPLHFASAHGDVKLANSLLKEGASVNSVDHDGWTITCCF